YVAVLPAEPGEQTERPSKPGRAAAVISGLVPPSRRGDTVYLSGASSAFAERYDWSLVAPPGSGAKLVGAATEQPTFVVDAPGSYAVTLTVNAGTSAEHTTTATFDVTNSPPTAADDLYGLSLA